MTVFYIDPEFGNDANNGTSFALRRRSLAGISTPVTNDEIRFIASPAPYSIGSGSWVDGNEFVTLTTPAKVIEAGGTNWTASANVTAVLSTSIRVQGTNAQQLTMAAGFTTGLAAYYPLPSTLNLSAYDTVSFMLLSSVATLNTGYLALCSDAAGAVPVETIRFNNTRQVGSGGLSNVTASDYTPIVWNKGSALSNGINSIAIYFDVDPGSATVYIDNIIATTETGGVTHRSMIGKNTVSEPWFWPVSYILDTGIGVGQWGAVVSSAPITRRPYNGVTEAANVYVQQVQLGTLGSADRIIPGSAAIKITGGWDRTAMTTQSGQTWYGNNYSGSGGSPFGTGARVVTELSNFSLVRWESAPMPQTFVTTRQVDFYNMITNSIIQPPAAPLKGDWQIRHIVGCRMWIIPADAALGYPKMSIEALVSPALSSTGTAGLRWSVAGQNYNSGRYAVRIQKAMYAGYFALQPSDNVDIYGCTFTGNGTISGGDVTYNTGATGSAGLIGCSTNPTVVSASLTAGGGFGGEVWDASHIWRKGITYTQQSAVHNLQPTATQGAISISSLFTTDQPSLVRLARIAAPAGTTTITASARKDNLGAYAALMVKRFSAPGVTADVVSTPVSLANTWETLSLPVTTTADSVIEVYGILAGSSGQNVYFGDVAWS